MIKLVKCKGVGAGGVGSSDFSVAILQFGGAGANAGSSYDIAIQLSALSRFLTETS